MHLPARLLRSPLDGIAPPRTRDLSRIERRPEQPTDTDAIRAEVLRYRLRVMMGGGVL